MERLIHVSVHMKRREKKVTTYQVLTNSDVKGIVD